MTIYELRDLLETCSIEDLSLRYLEKDKYYEIYNRTDTDEFILCDTMENVNAILSSYGIKND